MLLGQHTPVVAQYSPQLLHPIPRATARRDLGLGQQLPFFGVDQWHAYEMSWLDDAGKPVVKVGRFQVPADSPNIVESKSFKLYLNSLNNTRFASDEEAQATIVADIGAVAGASVTLVLFPVGDAALAGARLSGESLDNLPLAPWDGEPQAQQLQLSSGEAVEATVYSHLLRSLCPVTGQPDWATVWIHYQGAEIERSSLLQYIIAYREHQEFHEQCVERMFCDISARCEPNFLHIQAFYTRRGGMDINPFRSTDPSACALPRLDRQ
ncbi:NADPH-dependent 7-cyano-7-deazaguanine reductase [Halioglobus japonicus]|nr:NADPH-dependent 7-cyano-7-deazaguanine reductase [Halioglobus japonicus]